MPDRIPPHFTKMLVRQHLNRGWCRETIHDAVEALQAGYDSPSLRILAGLPEKEPLLNTFELESYLKSSLEELGYAVPDRRTCLSLHVHDIAQAIASGEITPEDGCIELRSIAQAAPDADLPIGWAWGLAEDLSLARDGIYGDIATVNARIVENARTVVQATKNLTR